MRRRRTSSACSAWNPSRTCPQIEKVDLHVDPSQIDPIEQKPDAPQTEDQLPAQQEVQLMTWTWWMTAGS